MALTRRGRAVKFWAQFVAWLLIILAILWIVGEVTTPEECKGDIETLSQFCLDLRFP